MSDILHNILLTACQNPSIANGSRFTEHTIGSIFQEHALCGGLNVDQIPKRTDATFDLNSVSELARSLTRTLKRSHLCFPRLAFQWCTMGLPPRLLFQASAICGPFRVGLMLLSLCKPSARRRDAIFRGGAKKNYTAYEINTHVQK
jgi:hypothetical protein